MVREKVDMYRLVACPHPPATMEGERERLPREHSETRLEPPQTLRGAVQAFATVYGIRKQAIGPETAEVAETQTCW